MVDFNDAFHLRQGDHDSATDRKTAAGKTGSRSPWHKGHFGGMTCLHDGDNLLGRVGKHDDIGLVFLDGETIAFLDEQIAGRGQDAVGADDGTEQVG